MSNPNEHTPAQGLTANAPRPTVETRLHAAPRAPLGLIAPEWALQRSARGAALWRHAGAMNASAREDVEVFALDLRASGRPFVPRDQWNVPAPDARFRVRRVPIGGRLADVGELERARLEGLVLDWLRERGPRLVHVLDLELYGIDLLWALEAAGVPTVVTLERIDALRAALGAGASRAHDYGRALSTVRRIVVSSAKDAAVAEALGAPREKIRVLAPGAGGETTVLRAYASLYRLIGGSASVVDVGTSAGGPSEGAAA